MRLILAPNRSLSWHGNVAIWIALALLALLVAVGMALIGAWVVLPFAGIELMALATALYYTAHACQRQEVLIISDHQLRLEKGHRRKQAEWSLPRSYTRLHLTPGAHPESPPKLFLVHRDTSLPLGEFLNRTDTEALIAILERQGIRAERQLRPPSLWFWY
ncbi:DUF2244 domain-containing protein [Marinobacter sp. SS21]|uniref:DUF2244 domain-containing protein n=1 Tax=Marinobacter sp. SS21 TaxID=2979460 RepID=UPI00232C2553|nr:DUF2244 domain-containing protein [Marinobacter sp. SS21]MDC0661512.1 DUF2244 domain-containing protein [Marinobacter sp. SS21]